MWLENIILTNGGYLGVKIDRTRTFLEHRVEKAEVVKSVYSRLVQVAKSDWGLNENTCKLIYKAVFVPMMSYGSSVWAENCLTKVHPKRRALRPRRYLSFPLQKRTAPRQRTRSR